VRTPFSTRRAIGVTTASYATLTLIPWAIDATRTPRAGFIVGAIPLALLFGALAGYATASLTLTLHSPSSVTLAESVTTAPLHTRAGAHLVVVNPPQDMAPAAPPVHLHLVRTPAPD